MAPAAWTEGYESLRCYVLEGRQRLQHQPAGLALWVTKGMAGWMRKWRQLLEPAVPLTSAAPRLRLAELGPGPEPLTRLLAQITLQHLQSRVSL